MLPQLELNVCQCLGLVLNAHPDAGEGLLHPVEKLHSPPLLPLRAFDGAVEGTGGVEAEGSEAGDADILVEVGLVLE